jgi:hypothetical protein
VTRQCDLLNLRRSGTSEPEGHGASAPDQRGPAIVSPFYRSRKIRIELWARGYDLGRDKIRRLMRRLYDLWWIQQKDEKIGCSGARYNESYWGRSWRTREYTSRPADNPPTRGKGQVNKN